MSQRERLASTARVSQITVYCLQGNVLHRPVKPLADNSLIQFSTEESVVWTPGIQSTVSHQQGNAALRRRIKSFIEE